jgi:two-component system OmpR family sensor kinase
MRFNLLRRRWLSALQRWAARLVPTRVRQLSERTPLRVKLISAVLALVTMALAVFSVAGVLFMRRYFVGQADDQLRQAGKMIAGQVEAGRGRLFPPLGMVLKINYSDGTSDSVSSPPTQVVGNTGPTLPTNPPTLRPYTTLSANGDGDHWRAFTIALDDGTKITIAENLKEVDARVRELVLVDFLLGTSVIIVLALVGAWIVRTSLKPLEQIETTAEAIAGGDLSRRVPERDPRTEVGRLGDSLNGMLGQIETAFTAQAASEAAARRSEDRMRRFVADASHELRTPLTAIRGFAEFYRQGAARTPEETGRLLGRIESAASRMGLLVEDLLLLARMDQQRPLDRKPVDLLAVAADAVQEARATAPSHPIELVVAGGIYQVIGDEQRLRQVLGNLLANAITHTPEGTPVEVRLRPGMLGDLPAAVCEVVDAGPGLAPEAAERIFERFYRADAARSQGGTGLGLSIVAALVAAHEGTVEVESEPGDGATFRVTLPLAPD